MTPNRSLSTALIGGTVGAFLASGIVLLAAPKLIGERIVRQTLLDRPELLIEAGEALKSKQYANAIAPIRARLESPYFSSWKGAAKPAVTLTYFYDYACGYCRLSNPDLERLVKETPDLRVVYRELPILGPESVVAARVALAASRQGKFAAFHDAMYASNARPSAQSIEAAAKLAGVAPTPPEPSQDAELSANQTMAGQLGATGTPLFVIGDRVINSAAGYDVLKAAVNAARKS